MDCARTTEVRLIIPSGDVKRFRLFRLRDWGFLCRDLDGLCKGLGRGGEQPGYNIEAAEAVQNAYIKLRSSYTLEARILFSLYARQLEVREVRQETKLKEYKFRTLRDFAEAFIYDKVGI